MEILYLFVFSHYPTQNRFALLLEMLKKKGHNGPFFLLRITK
ncbi:hypothetical protein CEV33_1496 [Brucella grignonensis]|uniref:Uncharacterized protein n=1 Tax=Brucella grignonensis TaxID=94627 RepID=A0A256FAZ2_9HYPH|nr:hypothetical protein CEV33_1496 [Brucella grignonensis]